MTVYVVAQLTFTNENLYRRYQSRFAGVFKQFNGRVLAADESPVLLEGEWSRNKIVMMAFPDEAEARRFLDSPGYREISEDRIAGAETVALLVKGFPEPEPAAVS